MLRACPTVWPRHLQAPLTVAPTCLGSTQVRIWLFGVYPPATFHFGVPVAFGLERTLRNFSQTTDKVWLSPFLQYYRTGLLLNCYTVLQRAETLIHSCFLMAETRIIAWNFCCLCRGAGLIEIFGNLIRRAVSGFRETEKSTIASQAQRGFQA